MNRRRSGHATWTQDHRAEYNRWAGRHTWLIWATVAGLLAILLILIAARLSHPLPPRPWPGDGRAGDEMDVRSGNGQSPAEVAAHSVDTDDRDPLSIRPP